MQMLHTTDMRYRTNSFVTIALYFEWRSHSFSRTSRRYRGKQLISEVSSVGPTNPRSPFLRIYP